MASCPRCSQDLTVRQATPPGQKESVDVDCCGRCGGVWIDGAELSRASRHLGGLFGKRGELVLSSRPSGINCPRCSAALSEVGVNDVAVDWCQTCYGVWLDGGEYQELSQQKRKAQPSTVVCYACRKQVPLGDTYYTDLGIACSACRDVELRRMADHEIEYQRVEQERQRQLHAQGSDRLRALRHDLDHATYGELRALRDALK